MGNQLIPIPPTPDMCAAGAQGDGSGIPIVPLAVAGGVAVVLVSLLS